MASQRVEFVKVFAAVFGLAMAVSTVNVSVTRAEPSQQTAREMLQDGIDALNERQSALAAQLFEQLILAYPGTSESLRAERELSALNSPPTASDGPEDAPEAGVGKLNRRRESESDLRKRFTVDAGDRVFFAENSAVIGGRARAVLESQARWLAALPDLRVTIIGRADDGGPADGAVALSIKRAEAVRDKLIASGVAAPRILIDGRGASDPIATCQTPLCQAQNRHAETLIGGGIVTGSDTGPDNGPDNGLEERLSKSRAGGAKIGDVSGGATVSR
jgi:peptidoglycan-associated lipoprotein